MPWYMPVTRMIQKHPAVIMKTMVYCALTLLAFLIGNQGAAAQGTRFFRISGPAATTIMAFRPDGTLVWSNAQPGATYTIQTVATLPGGSNWVNYVQLPTTSAFNTNQLISLIPPAGMVLIPAGSFTMGDALDSEYDAVPTTNVSVSAFYMDVNLVSYGLWLAVCNWATNNGYTFYNNAVSGKGTDHPVQLVDWFSALKWCNARSQQAGLTPVYYTDAGLTQPYTNHVVTAYANWTANGYRLPTEAEWEKAARGGLSGQRFPSGDTISESQANYQGDTTNYSYDFGPSGYNATYMTGGIPYTSPVGSFAANGYGLRDMAGNISEWCWDWYAGPPYPPGSPYLGGSDPRGPVSIFPNWRVFRGGGWDNVAIRACCADRSGYTPTVGSNDVGFRCARRY